MNLEKLRQAIDLGDAKMEKLFLKRLALVEKVAAYKKEKALPIYDAKREEEILGRYEGPTREFFQEMLRLSRKQQGMLLYPYNIIFTGFMGTGKTTVGAQVAKALGRDFYDTDQLLQKRLGLSIAKYFQKEGERAFREREKELIKELSRKEKTVLALGGGVVLDPRNVSLLACKGRFVLLKASSKVIYERIKEGSSRPLLGKEITVAKIEKLQKKRAEIYLNCADLILETDNLSSSEVAYQSMLGLYKINGKGGIK